MERKDPGRGWSGALIALFVLAGAVFYVNSYFFRSEPQKLTEFPCDGKTAQDCALAKAEEFFKYGSLGGEATAGIPYELFVVLPEVFSEDLPGPGGYRSFGLPWEEGRILPVGFSVATLGMERVTQTCAVCHTTSYRVSAGAQPQFAPAGPGNMTNLGALLTFLGKAAASENFDAAHLLPAMQQRFDMTLPERLWYRIVIIPYLRAALQEQVAALQWRHDKERPDWGPGRDGSMNLARLTLLAQDDDGAVDNSDFPSIWNIGGREGHLLQWAGETSDLMTFIRDSAFGLGARPGPEFETRMRKLRTYLIMVQPPEMPAGFRTDAALVPSGRALFAAYCADCHGPAGKRTGTVIPIDEIGTDPNRFNTWTPHDDQLVNAYMAGQGVERLPMQKQGGYIAAPLDGLWLRAPYLHNGSVPTIRELLQPPLQRTTEFYRGCDIVDGEELGFRWHGDSKVPLTQPENCALAFHYDTHDRGNGNQGHDYGGTDQPGLPALDSAQVRALIAYLKTL